MRALFLAVVLTACSMGPAEAGDLWLSVDQSRATESIYLHLPGNWLTEASEPVTVEVEGGSVDLTKEAKALKTKGVGATRSWTVADSDGPTTVTLSNEARTGKPAEQLQMQTLGPKGNGLTVTAALEPEQVGQATGHLQGVLDLDGVQVELDKALCEQLRQSGPVTLVKTTGPKGGGIVIGTR